MENTAWAYGSVLFPENESPSSSSGVDAEIDDWNTRFQTITAMPTTTTAEKLHKYTLLHTLNKDFIACASTYARIIVSELYLPDEQKSIHLKPLGGLAGGKKYLWRGILFKFANGMQGPYNNNDEYAAKAIGHDLKGANSYLRCGISGLHVALQAVIDYKGHRVHAQAQLPIDETTIVIGSADACQTIRSNNFDLLQKLKFAAQELNLREHTIKDIKLYSACDIEGHIGHDKRAYIIDLARTFPPEDPTVATHLQSFAINDVVLYYDHTYTIVDIVHGKHTLRCRTHEVKCVPASQLQSTNSSIFWRLLRPELVKHYGSILLDQLVADRNDNSSVVLDSMIDSTSPPASTVASNSGSYSFANVMTAAPSIPSLARNTSYGSTRSDGMYDASELLLSPVHQITSNDHSSVPSNPNSSSGSYLDAAMKSAPTLRKTTSHPAPTPAVTTPTSAPSLRRFTSTPTRPLTILAPRNETPRETPEDIPDSADLPVISPALSPDAFSRFSQSDPTAQERNREVTNATRFLIHKLIPEMAKNLTFLASSDHLAHLNITEYMHRYGVNIRHLGLLFSHIPTKSETKILRSMLIHECILRTLKHISRDMIRTYMKHCSTSSEDGIHVIWIQILNLVSGVHRKSKNFWEMVKDGVRKRFGSVAIVNTANDVYPGWTLIDSPTQSISLILRLCSVSGVRLSEHCRAQLTDYLFEFTVADIVEIVPVVKHMHQVDLAEGILLSLLAQEREKHQHNAIITRLLSLSASRLHRALHTLPNDVTTSLALADVYQAWGLATSNDQYFRLSVQYLTAEHTRCSQTSTSYRDDVLGIVVMVTHYPRNDTKQNWRRSIKHVNFCLDIICHRYFTANRETILSHFESAFGQSDSVARFFPLVIDEEHASRSLPLLIQELLMAYAFEDKEYPSTAISLHLPTFTPTIGLAVIAAIMNSMVVDFVSAAEKGNLSETALHGYSRFHHMLLYLSHHACGGNWVDTARKVVDVFISSPKHRSKTYTPDLGRLLVYLLASGKVWDDEIGPVFLQEAFTRQVGWWLNDAWELLVLEDEDISLYRLATTFAASKKALRIIMFQIYFIQSVAPRVSQNSDWLLQLYNSSLGRPTAAMRGDVVMEFQAILAVSNYETFLKRVSCSMSPAELCCHLRRAVRCSVMYWRENVKGRYKGVIDSWNSNHSSSDRSSTSNCVQWETILKEMGRIDFAAEKSKRRALLRPLVTVGKRNSGANNTSTTPTRQITASTSGKWERGAKPAENGKMRRGGSAGVNNRRNGSNSVSGNWSKFGETGRK